MVFAVDLANILQYCNMWSTQDAYLQPCSEKCNMVVKTGVVSQSPVPVHFRLLKLVLDQHGMTLNISNVFHHMGIVSSDVMHLHSNDMPVSMR